MSDNIISLSHKVNDKIISLSLSYRVSEWVGTPPPQERTNVILGPPLHGQRWHYCLVVLFVRQCHCLLQLAFDWHSKGKERKCRKQKNASYHWLFPYYDQVLFWKRKNCFLRRTRWCFFKFWLRQLLNNGMQGVASGQLINKLHRGYFGAFRALFSVLLILPGQIMTCHLSGGNSLSF